MHGAFYSFYFRITFWSFIAEIWKNITGLHLYYLRKGMMRYFRRDCCTDYPLYFWDIMHRSSYSYYFRLFIPAIWKIINGLHHLGKWMMQYFRLFFPILDNINVFLKTYAAYMWTGYLSYITLQYKHILGIGWLIIWLLLHYCYSWFSNMFFTYGRDSSSMCNVPSYMLSFGEKD